MTSPADWTFTGVLPVVQVAVPPPVPPGQLPAGLAVPEPLPRSSGWKVMGVDGIGCLPAAVATLTGQSGAIVARVLGDEPRIADASIFVQHWSAGELRLIFWPIEQPWTPVLGAKAIALYRAHVGRRVEPERDEAGRFLAAPLHAAVVHGDDLSLYHDPHVTPVADIAGDAARLGHLLVVPNIDLPASATFPLPDTPST